VHFESISFEMFSYMTYSALKLDKNTTDFTENKDECTAIVDVYDGGVTRISETNILCHSNHV
jgi:hypothetical protein